MLKNIRIRTNEENKNFEAFSSRIREKLLNPILQVNLRDMCLRKVVINLWNSDDMLILMQNFQCDSMFAIECRETVERQMKYKVSKLGLPEPLEVVLVPLIAPIGWEILRWRTFHEYLLSRPLQETIDKHVLKQLHWTCIGAIDYVGTMQELIRLEVFDLEERYVLACCYCLESEIRVLWEQLPEERKCEYGDRRDVSKLQYRHWEYYWPYVLKGEEHLLPDLDGSSFYNYAFNTSATFGNKMAIEHFFHKLTSKERDSSLLKAFDAAKGTQLVKITLRWPFDYGYMRISDVFHFLLSVMNPTQLKLALKTDYYSILLCLRNWPWHELFLDVMDLIWTFLPDESTVKEYVLQAIWNKKEYSAHLFQEVFKQSPEFFKRCIVTSEFRHFSFLSQFFLNGDAETLKVVIKYLGTEDRLRLVSCNEFIRCVDSSIMRDEWNCFKACFGGCTLSENDINGLIKDYKKLLEGTDLDEMAFVGPVESRKHRWEKAFDLLDKIKTGTSDGKNLKDEKVTKEKKRTCNEKEKNVVMKN